MAVQSILRVQERMQPWLEALFQKYPREYEAGQRLKKSQQGQEGGRSVEWGAGGGQRL